MAQLYAPKEILSITSLLLPLFKPSSTSLPFKRAAAVFGKEGFQTPRGRGQEDSALSPRLALILPVVAEHCEARAGGCVGGGMVEKGARSDDTSINNVTAGPPCSPANVSLLVCRSPAADGERV